jgi:PIN domain nuclease of toxin-antitoxin system
LDDAQLSLKAKSLIEDPATDVYISPASFWEIAIKVSLGKLDLQATYDDFIRSGIAGNAFAILPIEPKHTSVLTKLPFHHKDPFDRLLVAQTTVERMTIVSCDEQLDAYGVPRVW